MQKNGMFYYFFDKTIQNLSYEKRHCNNLNK